MENSLIVAPSNPQGACLEQASMFPMSETFNVNLYFSRPLDLNTIFKDFPYTFTCKI